MTLIKYEHWNPKPASIELVDDANYIINEYEEMGYTLTLRQLYYQFVARNLIPNTERSYKNLGTLITKGRMAGMISWEAIEDRNRAVKSFWYDEDIMNPIKQLPNFIRFDRWAWQEYYVEVWVEKEALGNVVERACTPLLVPHLSCKGYLSASEAWRAGQRVKEKAEDRGQKPIIIHLGDHDPSGLDMSRDNQDRLDLFSHDSGVELHRIALNMDQVEEYSPPTNPTKFTDSRAKDYARKYGNSSWELDALEPAVLEKLITDKINTFIDADKWQSSDRLETKAEDKLRKVYDNWDKIETLLDE